MNTEPIHRRYDVIVAGARAAGASTAMLLARAGASVLVVDPARRGSDTLSTHALMRAGVLQLHRWGVLDAIREAGTPVIRTTSFHYDAEEIALLIEPRDGVDGLYAPRRTVLDEVLVRAAEEAGARVVHGVALHGLQLDDGGRVRGGVVAAADGLPTAVAADLVIGADGRRSRVAELAGAELEHLADHATATIYGYWPDLAIDGFHWHFARGSGGGVGAGALPTNGGETGVFAGLASERFHAERAGGLERLHRTVLAEAAPELAQRVEQSPAASKLRGFAGERSFCRRPVGPGWALVGDAGCFRDPLTAHGITDALRDAELLARAAAVDTPTAYRAFHELRDQMARPLLDVTDRIASLDWTLDALKQLHRDLSRSMKAEVELLLGLDAPSEASRRIGPAAESLDAHGSASALRTSTNVILSPL